MQLPTIEETASRDRGIENKSDRPAHLKHIITIRRKRCSPGHFDEDYAIASLFGGKVDEERFKSLDEIEKEREAFKRLMAYKDVECNLTQKRPKLNGHEGKKSELDAGISAAGHKHYPSTVYDPFTRKKGGMKIITSSKRNTIRNSPDSTSSTKALDVTAGGNSNPTSCSLAIPLARSVLKTKTNCSLADLHNFDLDLDFSRLRKGIPEPSSPPK